MNKILKLGKIPIRFFHKEGSKPIDNTKELKSDDEVNFGFQKVKLDDKQSMVNEVFSSVANKYDVMNDVMSMGIHRIWKDYLINDIGILRPKRIFKDGSVDKVEPIKIIDVATGSGDIAFRVLDYQQKNNNTLDLSQNLKITLSDVNGDMLEEAKKKAKENNLNEDMLDYIESSAEQFKDIPDNTYDIYVISYGLRNVPNTLKALKEAYRILKPGGRFLCLEFSKVQNPLLNQFYKFYSFNVIPMMGKLVANDSESYQYLAESIEKFYTQEELLDLITEAGFSYSRYENITFGVTAIHSGFKIE